MTAKNISMDDLKNPENLPKLADLFIALCAERVMVQRNTDEVMPLEVMGLASLILADAWKSVNEELKNMERRNGI
jgi:hypothetical protein